MGNTFEQEMWTWLETHREEAQRRFVAEIRSIVNDPKFNYAESLPDFFDWCMDHYRDKPEDLKPEHWKQANPLDQYTVILMSMEGQIAIREKGIISDDQFRQRMREIYRDLKALEQFIRQEQDWYAAFSPKGK